MFQINSDQRIFCLFAPKLILKAINGIHFFKAFLIIHHAVNNVARGMLQPINPQKQEKENYFRGKRQF